MGDDSSGNNAKSMSQEFVLNIKSKINDLKAMDIAHWQFKAKKEEQNQHQVWDEELVEYVVSQWNEQMQHKMNDPEYLGTMLPSKQQVNSKIMNSETHVMYKSM